MIRSTLAILGLLVAFAGCKTVKHAKSDLNMVFTDDRRVPVEPSFVPNVLRVGNCTGFILDPQLGIGMTADHCRIRVGFAACHVPKHSSFCDPSVGVVTEIIESSSNFSRAAHDYLDYTIFKFRINRPSGIPMLGSYLVSDKESFDVVRKCAAPLTLQGYPKDRNHGDLVQGRCFLQSQIGHSGLTQKTVPFDPHYPNAQTNFSASKEDEFIHDCSVYQEVSGTGITLQGTSYVVGMPNIFKTSPQDNEAVIREAIRVAQQSGSYSPQWEQKFRADRQEISRDWNQIQRQNVSKDYIMKNFPRAIPAPLIVENSPFFRANPQYTVNLGKYFARNDPCKI